jgi:hypothetical protein
LALAAHAAEHEVVRRRAPREVKTMVGRVPPAILLVSMLFFGSMSCLDNEAASDKVNIKGTIVQPEAGIGCGNWGVRSDDGRVYEITKLPEEFQSPGLAVVARLQLRPDMASTCMAGTIADVIEIKKGA